MALEVTGLPDRVMSDERGNYRFDVEYGWEGTVTPLLDGYAFTPPSRPYNHITANKMGENFTPEKITYEISGTVTINGVALAGRMKGHRGIGLQFRLARGNFQLIISVDGVIAAHHFYCWADNYNVTVNKLRLHRITLHPKSKSRRV